MVSLELDSMEIKFLKRLLNLYFRSFNWRRGSPFESIMYDFPKCSIVTVPDKLLRKVEKASEGFSL